VEKRNEQLYALYSSPTVIRVIKSRRIRQVGLLERMGDRTGTYRVLVGRPEGRKKLGRHRHRLEDNIKMALQEVGWGDMDWIAQSQDRGRWWVLVNAVMNLRVP
jgi:hypothetical protein